MHYRIIILLSLISSETNAQVQLYNLDLTDSTKSFLYIGVDNTIKIKWGNLKPAAYIVTIDDHPGARIEKKNDSMYNIQVKKITNNFHIIIRSTKGKILLKKVYTSALITYEGLTWNRFRSYDKVSRDSLLANPVLVYDCGNNYYRCKIEVLSFVLTVDLKDSIASEPATGNRLSAKQIELLGNANKNGLLTIDDIRAMGPDGRTVKLPGMVFYYKD